MDTASAVEAMSALAHAHRMEIFRTLVKEGPAGLPAGKVAARLGIGPSSLSFHISHLERAGLVRSRRESRSVIYAVDVMGMRRLLDFLTRDCCDGRPELCGGLPHAAGRDETKGALADG